jgi:hypothetical protein
VGSGSNYKKRKLYCPVGWELLSAFIQTVVHTERVRVAQQHRPIPHSSNRSLRIHENHAASPGRSCGEGELDLAREMDTLSLLSVHIHGMENETIKLKTLDDTLKVLLVKILQRLDNFRKAGELLASSDSQQTGAIKEVLRLKSWKHFESTAIARMILTGKIAMNYDARAQRQHFGDDPKNAHLWLYGRASISEQDKKLRIASEPEELLEPWTKEDTFVFNQTLCVGKNQSERNFWGRQWAVHRIFHPRVATLILESLGGDVWASIPTIVETLVEKMTMLDEGGCLPGTNELAVCLDFCRRITNAVEELSPPKYQPSSDCCWTEHPLFRSHNRPPFFSLTQDHI